VGRNILLFLMTILGILLIVGTIIDFTDKKFINKEVVIDSIFDDAKSGKDPYMMAHDEDNQNYKIWNTGGKISDKVSITRTESEDEINGDYWFLSRKDYYKYKESSLVYIVVYLVILAIFLILTGKSFIRDMKKEKARKEANKDWYMHPTILQNELDKTLINGEKIHK